jgi:hypothetical protein
MRAANVSRSPVPFPHDTEADLDELLKLVGCGKNHGGKFRKMCVKN